MHVHLVSLPLQLLSATQQLSILPFLNMVDSLPWQQGDGKWELAHEGLTLLYPHPYHPPVSLRSVMGVASTFQECLSPILPIVSFLPQKKIPEIITIKGEKVYFGSVSEASIHGDLACAKAEHSRNAQQKGRSWASMS